MTEPVVHVTVEPPLVDKKTACKMLGGIAASNLMQLVAEDTLIARKLGGRTMFEPAELRRYVASLPTSRESK